MFTPGASGNITSNDMLGGKTTVIINNFTDAQATVNESEDGDGKRVEIVISRTKNSIASDIREGTGDVTKALQSSFGLRRRGV